MTCRTRNVLVVANLITFRALFSPIFLQRSSQFHASGLDSPFPVRRKDLGDISYTSRFIAVAVAIARGSIVVEFV